MGYILILLYVLFIIWWKLIKMDPPSKKIILIFTTYWFIVLFLSQLGLQSIHKPSDKSIILLILSVISFILGFSIIRIKTVTNFGLNFYKLNNQIKSIRKNPLFLFLYISLFIYVIYLFTIFYKKLILVNSLDNLREEFYNSNLFGPTFNYINPFILSAMGTFILSIIGIISLKKKNIFWYSSLIFLLIYSSFSGARVEYFKILLPFLLIFYCFKINNASFNIKTILKILLGTSLVLLIFTYITSARLGKIELTYNNMSEAFLELSEQVYTYNVGPIIAFDYGINHNYLERIGGYKYGRLSMTSIDNFFNYGMKVYNKNYTSPIDEFAKIKQYTPINITNDYPWNALYTWNIFFYLDLGILGLIIFPFLIGYFCRFFIKNTIIKQNLSSFIILNIIFQIIILSPFDFTILTFGQTILFIFLLINSQKKIII